MQDQQKMQRLKIRRWFIWTPLAFAFLASYFHRTVTGVVADSLMSEFVIERAADLGILSSIYFYTYAILQVPAGILADYYGPRRVVSLSLVISACGAAFFGWTDSIGGLYAGRFFSSLGVALIYVNIAKIQAEWFRVREFATMSGLLTFVGNSGSLLAATPLAFIVDAVGWRSSFYLIAAYSLVMALICWLMVRDRPGDIGLPSIIEIEKREGKICAPVEKGKESVLARMKVVFKNPFTWPPFLASVAMYGVYMSIIGVWGIPYLMQVYGMPRVAAANHMLFMVIGNMVGAPLLGFLSDRLGFRRWPYVGSAAGILAAWLVTIWHGAQPPEWMLYPICLALGLGVSGVSLTVACVKEVNPRHLTGMAAGIANSGAFVGGALLQAPFGWILDQYWQGSVEQGVRLYPVAAYQSAFLFCAGVLVAGLLCALLIKETHCKELESRPAGSLAQ